MKRFDSAALWDHALAFAVLQSQAHRMSGFFTQNETSRDPQRSCFIYLFLAALRGM